jgi:chromosome segregation ATPase
VEELTRPERREESLNKQLQDLKQDLRNVDERNQRSEYEAENLVREYNELAVKTGIVPQSAKYAGVRTMNFDQCVEVIAVGDAERDQQRLV